MYVLSEHVFHIFVQTKKRRGDFPGLTLPILDSPPLLALLLPPLATILYDEPLPFSQAQLTLFSLLSAKQGKNHTPIQLAQPILHFCNIATPTLLKQVAVTPTNLSDTPSIQPLPLLYHR